MPRALDLGLGSILSTVAWFSCVGNLQKLYDFNESLGVVAKECGLGGPKELKLGPDHAQSSQDPGPDHAQDDFVDSCMVFMRWEVAEPV